MKLLNLFRQSFKSIFANKGRSFLTVLGIVIGIGSVIALVSLGNGVKDSITKQIDSLGTTTLTITPGAGFGGDSSGGNRQAGPRPGAESNRGGTISTLTKADSTALTDKTKVGDAVAVAGSVNGSAVYNSDQPYSVQGTTTSLFGIRSLTIDKGKVFSDLDVTNSSHVAVLGSDLASQLFGSDSPVGKTLTIQNDSYQIIGVFNKIAENNFNNLNLNAFVPYTSAMSTLGTDRFSNFVIGAGSQDAVDKVKAEAISTLLASHNIKDQKLADFRVSTPADLLATVGNVTGILTSLLSGIAAISLLVGGIGIMNIMLVSVTERTREIGLRKAVGAKTRDILVQFLIEAILLTLAGGVLGIGLGYAMGTIAGHYVGFAPLVTSGAILLAVGISTFVGLVFGIYPAIRASLLNPIDALRYE